MSLGARINYYWTICVRFFSTNSKDRARISSTLESTSERVYYSLSIMHSFATKIQRFYSFSFDQEYWNRMSKMYHQEPYLDLLQVWIEDMFVKLVALKEKAYWWCIALQLSFRSNQVGKISKAEHDFIMIQSKTKWWPALA